MLIRVSPRHAIRSSEITPESIYASRRGFLKTGAVGALGLGLGIGLGAACRAEAERAESTRELGSLGDLAKSPLSTTGEELTPYDDVTSYNNFYEFGTDKSDPARNAQGFQPRPWTIEVSGEVAKPGKIGIDELIAAHTVEERIYRMRCVEAWSMVIPWAGIPLAAILGAFEPTEKAKYVEFRTLLDPERMPGQARRALDWPYREGLRMDEAMHPLAILAVGLYGKQLPNQNGAPLRLVVPWKYGFKGIKSIVSIRLLAEQPETSWNMAQPSEYGFYANVNPEVDHPRWSQARERRIGEFTRRKTLPFNGYADQVASLYSGMDLAKFF